MFGRRKGKVEQESDAPESTVDGDDSIPVSGAGTDGPYDIAFLPTDDIERIDLGSLRVPALPGTELRLETDESGAIVTAAIVAADSALQLGAFAAPRNEGIWDEVRTELLDGIRADNGTVNEIDGPHGVELVAEIDGPEGRQSLRFCGVDGPRWFLRAVYTGKAASDPAASSVLDQAFRAVVVDRGTDPMPVKDLIPMRLPKEITDSQANAAPQAPQAPRRGPEITEIG